MVMIFHLFRDIGNLDENNALLKFKKKKRPDKLLTIGRDGSCDKTWRIGYVRILAGMKECRKENARHKTNSRIIK